MTGVSLFAGVGGFDLAMENNNIDVVASVEIDKHAQNVLRKHFPKSTIFDDVQEVTGAKLIDAGFDPRNGIITGGFPCQDLSVAGKRAGLAGERSGLFWQIVRLIEETETEWFVIENVPGLLSSNGGRDMGIVVRALSDIGYGFAWRVLDSQYFGVPQRRRRIFIVGRRSCDTSGAEILFEREGLRRDFTQSQPQRENFTTSAARSFGQSSFAGYTEGPATLTATTYKKPEDNVVVQ